MRKILTLTGSCLLALSLAACGASNAGSDKSQTPSKNRLSKLELSRLVRTPRNQS